MPARSLKWPFQRVDGALLNAYRPASAHQSPPEPARQSPHDGLAQTSCTAIVIHKSRPQPHSDLQQPLTLPNPSYHSQHSALHYPAPQEHRSSAAESRSGGRETTCGVGKPRSRGCVPLRAGPILVHVKNALMRASVCEGLGTTLQAPSRSSVSHRTAGGGCRGTRTHTRDVQCETGSQSLCRDVRTNAVLTMSTQACAAIHHRRGLEPHRYSPYGAHCTRLPTKSKRPTRWSAPHWGHQCALLMPSNTLVDR